MTAGPLYAAALLLIATAVPKLRDPQGVAGMLSVLRLPAAQFLVRLWAAAEVAVAAAVLVFGGRVPAALLAACYLVFAALVVGALQHGGVASCGCLGAVETPPSAIHVAFDIGAAVLALAAVAAPVAGITSVVSRQPVAGVPFLTVVTVTAYLGYLLLARFSSLLSFRARP